jgi:hypothetical protein
MLFHSATDRLDRQRWNLNRKGRADLQSTRTLRCFATVCFSVSALRLWRYQLMTSNPEPTQ